MNWTRWWAGCKQGGYWEWTPLPNTVLHAGRFYDGVSEHLHVAALSPEACRLLNPHPIPLCRGTVQAEVRHPFWGHVSGHKFAPQTSVCDVNNGVGWVNGARFIPHAQLSSPRMPFLSAWSQCPFSSHSLPPVSFHIRHSFEKASHIQTLELFILLEWALSMPFSFLP